MTYSPARARRDFPDHSYIEIVDSSEYRGPAVRVHQPDGNVEAVYVARYPAPLVAIIMGLHSQGLHEKTAASQGRHLAAMYELVERVP
ncbi:MAG: hypothetical protein GVY24_08070 [Planctomycetes bacterium]|jgi:hypothetical protein|nr:hypothetical protein [Planctomycetota bacterium]